MYPILLEFAGFKVHSYGVSKALALLAAVWLLQREMQRRGRDPEPALGLGVAGLVGGFLGGKLYYLAEIAGDGITLHDLGGTGFTWYGGLIGGSVAVFLLARRQGIPPGVMAGMAAIPLAVAYGVGRLGCLLAGDGTYGTPTDLPWGMSFPNGVMPTTAVVHPTPLYEALAVFAIAILLWRLRDHVGPSALFGIFAILFGLQRFAVEFVRLNDEVILGMTAAQLWSLALAAVGVAMLVQRPRPVHRVSSARAA